MGSQAGLCLSVEHFCASISISETRETSSRCPSVGEDDIQNARGSMGGRQAILLYCGQRKRAGVQASSALHLYDGPGGRADLSCARFSNAGRLET